MSEEAQFLDQEQVAPDPQTATHKKWPKEAI